MGITEILKNILLFTANKMKISESLSKQPTQLFIRLLRQMIDSQGCCLTFYSQFIVIFWGSILCSVHFLEKAKNLNKFVRNMYLQINKVLNEVQFFIMCHLITTYIDKKGGVIKKSSEVKWQRIDGIYIIGGTLCVQMDFTWTFQANTKCNNTNHVCSHF